MTQGTTGLLTYAAPVTATSIPSVVDAAANSYPKLAVSASGETYGLGYDSTTNADAIDVYAAGDTSGTPERTFYDGTFSYTSSVNGIGVDQNGNAYVAIAEANAIDEVPGAQSGKVTAIATYGDVAPSTVSSYVAVDAVGNVFASSCLTNSISEFTAGQTTSVPTRTIIGPKTGLNCSKIAVDASDNLYALPGSRDSIEVFPATASGNASPLQTFPVHAIDLAVASGTPDAAAAERGRALRSFAGSATYGARKRAAVRPTCTLSGHAVAAKKTATRIDPPRPGTVLPFACPGQSPLAARLEAWERRR